MRATADGPVRIDKWLWAARFYKTRALAAAAVESGRVRIGGQRIKPARIVRVGELVAVDRGEERLEVVIRGLAVVRGPAQVAQWLYEETSASRQRRESAAVRRHLQHEPAAARQGRPSKREGRELRRWTDALGGPDPRDQRNEGGSDA